MAAPMADDARDTILLSLLSKGNGGDSIMSAMSASERYWDSDIVSTGDKGNEWEI